MRKELHRQNVQPLKVLRKLKAEGKKKEAKEYSKIIASNPLRYFCPNLVQERMIQEMVEAQKEADEAGKSISTSLFSCGNGVGKTSGIINIICNLVYGPQNAWFDYEIFWKWPYPKHITLLTTPANIEENYFATSSGAASFLHYLFGKPDVEYLKGGKTHVKHVKFGKTGWQMNIITYNQAASEVESFTTGLVVVDEPAPQSFWKALPSRMRKGAIVLMPMTPLDCEPYILDDVIRKADEGVPGYRHIKASARDVLTTKERGHYSEKAFAGQMEKYEEEEKAARIDGEIMFFKERIIETYDRKIHFVDPAEYPLRQNYLYYHIVDPGDGKPNAEIWGAVTPEGRRIIFFEAPVDQRQNFWDMKGGTTVHDHIIQSLHYEKLIGERHKIWLNPSRILDYHFANQTRGGAKTNLWEDYDREARKLGVRFSFSPSYTVPGGVKYELAFGHKKIRQLLKYLPDGKPGLVIWNTCFHTDNGLTHYVRKRPRTESELLLPPDSRTIIQRYKDFPDVIRYFACADIIRDENPDIDYDSMLVEDASDALY